MYKQTTNAVYFYDVFLFICSPTCFGQEFGHLQGDDTRIQLQLNVSPSIHNV